MRKYLFKSYEARYLLFITLAGILFFGCQSKPESGYFKLTLTDQPKPVGLLPECIEINSDGKLVILTNRFNEGHEIYQQTYFIELTKKQLDSVKLLSAYLQQTNSYSNIDSTFNYKIKFDNVENKNRSSHIYLASNSDAKFSKLVNYCKKLPEINHRYALKQSYYFNTDEICLKIRK